MRDCSRVYFFLCAIARGWLKLDVRCLTLLRTDFPVPHLTTNGDQHLDEMGLGGSVWVRIEGRGSEDILSIWDSIWVKGIGNGLFEGIWASIFGGILVG